MSEKGKSLSRRDFLRIAVATGSAVMGVNLIKFVDPEFFDTVLATSGPGPYYYGTDTSWAVDTVGSNASNFPQNFYIGRTGVGELIKDDSGFFPDAADKAGHDYTHSYWNLKGPYYSFRGGRDCHQYGIDQATVAARAKYEHTWASKIGGKTIFADIEEEVDENDGWRDSNGIYNVADNRAVLEGFLEGIVNYTRNNVNQGLNPGIYTRIDLWQTWFGGADYDIKYDIVVWLAGGHYCKCSPCGSCTTAKTEADSDFDTKKEIAFGKYKTVIWQFYTKSGCGSPSCADYDIARQNGFIKFLPIMPMYLPIVKGGPIPNQSQRSSSDVYPPPQSETNTLIQNLQSSSYPPPPDPVP